MAIVTDSTAVDIILAILPIIYLIYWVFNRNKDYWDKRGVPNIKGGMLMDSITGRKTQIEVAVSMDKKFPCEKYFGLFQLGKPFLWVRDPELIQKILVKDFSHFQDRPNPQFKKDPLTKNLFGLRGQIWRALRYKLTPTFTTGKLRRMFEQLSQCGDNMMAKIEKCSKGTSEVESKTFLFEFTVDVISSCAFGVQFEPDSPDFEKFKLYVQKIFAVSPISFLKFAVAMSSPKTADYLGMRQTPKEVADYFFNLCEATSRYRKENNIKRDDYFQLLLTLQEQEESGKDFGLMVANDISEDDAVIDQMQYTEQNGPDPALNDKLFSTESICAQSFIFLLAGSESTASSISLVLMQVAQHPDVQLQLQKEVDSALSQHSRWSYDTIKEMTYLDQVIQESQRMHPLIAMLMRECVQPYKVPGTDLVIEKGVPIIIPVASLHMNPQYYPEPEKFRPERFEGNNFKPNPAFLPFGDGPRICIAMRFAVMEMKTCIAKIVSEYTVKLSPKMKLPIQYSRKTFTPTVEGGLWLSFEKRNKHF